MRQSGGHSHSRVHECGDELGASHYSFSNSFHAIGWPAGPAICAWPWARGCPWADSKRLANILFTEDFRKKTARSSRNGARQLATTGARSGKQNALGWEYETPNFPWSAAGGGKHEYCHQCPGVLDETADPTGEQRGTCSSQHRQGVIVWPRVATLLSVQGQRGLAEGPDCPFFTHRPAEWQEKDLNIVVFSERGPSTCDMLRGK